VSKPPLLGSTTTNSMMVPLDRLGAPGAPGHLIVSAVFSDDRYKGKDRLNDTSPREFEVKASLSKHPLDHSEIRGDIQPSHGSSFFSIPPGKSHLEIGTGVATISLVPNATGEVSMASAAVKATNPHQARIIFENMLAPCLDRLSFVGSVPILISLVSVRDVENEVQYVYFRSPPRHGIVSDHEEILYEEMRPVYALYREAQNSSSRYYQVLCLYKIMEGLLGSLQVSVRKMAAAAQKFLEAPKPKVPDHPDIAGDLRQYVGMPIKSFFDNFLTKAHRDAVAHFELKNSSALNVSSAADAERFSRVAFVADLCARTLIVRHESFLRQLHG
jgi:hypothetical protein